jgi:hypothetical protein
MPKFKSVLSLSVRSLLPAAALAGGAVSAFGQSTLVANSPFAAVGGPSAVAAAPAEAYELAGASIQGADVEVCIYDRQAKHSEWIPVGATSDGIHVISYDPRRDKAVVTVAGAKKELGLRNSTVEASATAQVAQGSDESVPGLPRSPAQPPTTAALLHDQNEARMLVSDLLEIGVQQRKAYQEAKLKAAEAPAQPTN